MKTKLLVCAAVAVLGMLCSHAAAQQWALENDYAYSPAPAGGEYALVRGQADAAFDPPPLPTVGLKLAPSSLAGQASTLRRESHPPSACQHRRQDEDVHTLRPSELRLVGHANRRRQAGQRPDDRSSS